MAIYIKIENIEGDVTAKGHKNWIQIQSFQLETKRHINHEPGRIADRENTRPTISEFILTKQMDKSSPYLFTEACVGKTKKEIKIDLCQTSTSLTPYVQYTLSNVIVSSYEIHSEPKEHPKEKISLSFDKMEIKY